MPAAKRAVLRTRLQTACAILVGNVACGPGECRPERAFSGVEGPEIGDADLPKSRHCRGIPEAATVIGLVMGAIDTFLFAMVLVIFAYSIA
jgi:hypothetical protein